LTKSVPAELCDRCVQGYNGCPLRLASLHIRNQCEIHSHLLRYALSAKVPREKLAALTDCVDGTFHAVSESQRGKRLSSSDGRCGITRPVTVWPGEDRYEPRDMASGNVPTGPDGHGPLLRFSYCMRENLRCRNDLLDCCGSRSRLCLPAGRDDPSGVVLGPHQQNSALMR
jgi:hypothetical protein